MKNQKHYGWQPCYRGDIAPVEKGQTNEGVLKKATTMCDGAELGIPEVVIDSA